MSAEALAAPSRLWTGIRPWLSRGALATADQALISGSNFVLSIFLARSLGQQQYGVYVLAMSVFLFVSGFHNSLLLEPMSVFGGADYRRCLPAYVGQLIRIHLTVTLVLAFLLICCAPVLAALGGPFSAGVLCGMALGFPSILLFWLLRRSAYLHQQYAPAVVAALAFNVVLLASIAISQQYGLLSPFVAFATQSLGALAAAAYLAHALRPESPSEEPTPPIRELAAAHWNYGKWACAATIVYWLSGEAYYFLVGSFLRIEDVAGLRAVQNITMPFPQFVTAMGLLFLPRISSAFSDRGADGVRKMAGALTAMFAFGAAVYFAFLVVFGKSIMEHLYSGKYRSYEHLLPLVGLYLVITAAGQGLVLGLRAMQAASEVFIAYLGAAAVTVIAGVAFTRMWGLTGAVAALMLTSFAFLSLLALRYTVTLRKNSVPC